MTHTSRHQTFRFALACLLFAGLTLLVACAPALPPADLERAARLRNEGLTFALKRDNVKAAERYTEATFYDPHNSPADRDLGDFLTVRRVEHREGFAAVGVTPTAVDVGLVPE